jgi:hypothetical protein
MIAAVAAIITDAIVVQYAAQSITNNVLVSIFSIITDIGAITSISIISKYY